MKRQHLRFRLLAFVVIGMLALAGTYGVYSVTTYSTRWFSNARNTRQQEAKSKVIPGDIIDRKGVVLLSADADGKRIYQDDQASRSSIVHLLGDTEGYVANGVETFQARYLLGFETSLTERVDGLLSGETHRGDNVTLTIDSKLCTACAKAFVSHEETRYRAGAVVVMNYRTGEILAMVSLPVFDPLDVNDNVKNSPLHPFWNRAIQSTMTPGSTFKIITAAAALSHLPDAETIVFNCTGATQPAGSTAFITDYNNEHHDNISLPKAFRVSCNNTFAQLALQLGDDALRQTAESFGFNDNFLFQDVVVENSAFPTKNRTPFEIAWSGVGQSQIVATPLHMCMVASAIANDGLMLEPRLVGKVESPAGVIRYQATRKEYRQAVSPEVAHTIKGYMRSVVEDRRGTGTAAAIEGVPIAGKTGSAETTSNGQRVTHAWFVGFIDDPATPYAVCVFVEEGGTGGKVAAPIAREVFAYILQMHP